MKSIRKYLAATALALSGLASGAQAQTELQTPPIRSLEVLAYWADVYNVYNRLEKKSGDMIKLLHQAHEGNNTVFQEHTIAAAGEYWDRLDNTCGPLFKAAQDAVFEETKNSPKLTDKASESFKGLSRQIMEKCHPDTFPAIKIRADGSMLSDAILDRRILQLWGLDITMQADRKALDIIAEFDRATNTSSALYLRRLRAYRDGVLQVQKECSNYRDTYMNAARTSNDLILIRRHRAALERICTRDPRA